MAASCPIQEFFTCVTVFSFMNREDQGTWHKPLTSGKFITNFLTPITDMTAKLMEDKSAVPW